MSEPTPQIEPPFSSKSAKIRHSSFGKAFLRSDWTDDEAKHKMARNAYAGSIGGWKKTVRDETVIHAYYRFRDLRIIEMAAEFLSSHGVNVDWDEHHIL